MSKINKTFVCNFTQVPNQIINDKNVSLKAKGLYLYFISKPDNWYFSLAGMASQLLESEKTILSIIDELCKFGYMTKIKVRNGSRNGVNNYELHEVPYFPPECRNDTVKVTLSKSHCQNSTTSNTINSNKERVIKKEFIQEGDGKPFYDFLSFQDFFRKTFTGIAFEYTLQNASKVELYVNNSGFLMNGNTNKKVSVSMAKDAYTRLYNNWDSVKNYFNTKLAYMRLSNSKG